MSYFLGKITIPVIIDLFVGEKYFRKNYLGKNIPNSLGVVFVLVLMLFTPIFLMLDLDRIKVIILLLAVNAMGLVGIIDDFLGNNVKGIKGHISMLLNGKLSTGALKAIVAITTSLMISMIFSRNFFDGLINLLIIVFFTNFINLMDLRPGRALKVFSFILFIFIIFIEIEIKYVLICMLGISIAYFPYDIKGLVMLGDAGSNVLGMFLGIIFTFLNLPTKFIILIFLLICHYYAEKKSITQLILNNRFLNYIDKIGR